MNSIDYGRSFVRFSTTGIDHTPRLGLAASCTLQKPDQSPVTYHLSVACIAENMYRSEGHIQEPVAEFNLILRPNVELMVLRKHADSGKDLRRAQAMNERMATHDGKGASVIELDAHLAQYKKMEPVTDYQTFKDALLGNLPMNGRTFYVDDKTRTKVTLDYPINTANVRHDVEGWQVDAGPILVPFEVNGQTDLAIEQLEMAFIVYNAWDYSELAIRELQPVGQSHQTAFYGRLKPLRCINQIFACLV